MDRNEFYWTFPELDLYEEFGKLDTDNSGFIELEEVDRATLERGRSVDCSTGTCFPIYDTPDAGCTITFDDSGKPIAVCQ